MICTGKMPTYVHVFNLLWKWGVILQKVQVKPVSPPSSAPKEKDTEEVKVNERGEESNEGVKDSSSSGSPEQAEGLEGKGEPLKPVVNSEKDPTEVEETKEGRENTGNKAEEGQGEWEGQHCPQDIKPSQA